MKNQFLMLIMLAVFVSACSGTGIYSPTEEQTKEPIVQTPTNIIKFPHPPAVLMKYGYSREVSGGEIFCSEECIVLVESSFYVSRGIWFRSYGQGNIEILIDYTAQEMQGIMLIPSNIYYIIYELFPIYKSYDNPIKDYISLNRFYGAVDSDVIDGVCIAISDIRYYSNIVKKISLFTSQNLKEGVCGL